MDIIYFSETLDLPLAIPHLANGTNSAFLIYSSGTSERKFTLIGHEFSHQLYFLDVSERLKGKIYSGGVLAVLLYGCES